jgi:hypothetical protein
MTAGQKEVWADALRTVLVVVLPPCAAAVGTSSSCSPRVPLSAPGTCGTLAVA